jgi:hypothetical protein
MAYPRSSYESYIIGDIDPYTPADGELNIVGDLDVSSNIFFDAAAEATPAVCPDGDPNTGIWAPAADTWAVSTAGTEAMRLNSSQQLDLIAGAVGAPSIILNSDADSGFYAIGADNWGLALGGANVVNYGAAAVEFAQPVVIPAGAVGTPSLYPTGDSDTGLYAIGADNLGIAIGGANVLNIAAASVTSAQVLLAPSGAVGGPAYSFSGDTDSGLYVIGADNLGLALGGSKVVDYGAAAVEFAQPVVIPAGAVGTPSLYPTGDSDTGLYAIGADNLGIAIGGSKLVDIGAAAINVAADIGMTGNKLDLSIANDDGEYIYSDADNSLKLYAGGNLVLGIANTQVATFQGNVTMLSNKVLSWGNALDASISWQTDGTYQDRLVLGLDDATNIFVIAEDGDKAFEHQHAAQANPTVFVHSANQSTTEFLGLTHDQTNGLITAGAGYIEMDAPGGVQLHDSGAAVLSAVTGTVAITGAATVSSTLDVTGVADFAAGAVGAPAITLNGDTDSGLYQIGADNLGVAIGGSKVVDIAAAAINVAADIGMTGNKLDCSIANDDGEYIYSSQDGQLDLVGTAIECTGAVGISSTLDVTGVSDFAAGAVGAAAITLNGDTDSGLYQIGADNIGIAIGGSKVIDIGAASVAVAQPLDVTGAVASTADLQLDEMSAPTGVANVAKIFAVDNGGKTELKVIFGTGAAIQLAIEA